MVKLKMNKKLSNIIIFITILIILNIGCIEEETINDKYDIYVGFNNNEYSTINKAIENSSKGDRIFISNGIYNEKIIINKSISIIGESNKTIINYKNNQTDEIGIITLLADNCTIDGININNPFDNNTVFGIVIKSSNNTIINNTIYNTNKGIFIDSKYDEYIINNTIVQNNLSFNNFGLHVAYADNNNISKNHVFNNQFYGIYLQNSDNNILKFNFLLQNQDYALRIKGSRFNKLYKNEISFNQKGLYFCCGARENLVYCNNFRQNELWHATDGLGNQWDNGIIGNYWDDYLLKYPNSEKNNGYWNIPYNITGGNYIDNYPNINPIEIKKNY
jgi:parallel beta-helix repeat protein